MEVICSICKATLELNEEEVEKMAAMLLINSENAKSGNYTRILNIISGNTCIDEKEHKYMFHDEFELKIDGIVSQCNQLNVDKEKLINRQNELMFREENLKNELDKISDQLIAIPNDLEQINMEFDALHTEFVKMVGNIKHEMW